MSTTGKRIVLWDDLTWDDSESGGMEFRLTYDGVLLASNGNKDTKRARKDGKHRIRQRFHKQIKHLYETTPLLHTGTHSGRGLEGYVETTLPRYEKEAVAASHQRYNNWTFLPLVTSRLKLSCWLDISFFSKQERSEGVWKLGDIDNRIKTIFDCLQIPDDNQNYENRLPEEDESPFYCLLQNDSLISKVSVETDLLLEDLNTPFDQNDARLIITVRLRPYEVTLENILFS